MKRDQESTSTSRCTTELREITRYRQIEKKRQSEVERRNEFSDRHPFSSCRAKGVVVRKLDDIPDDMMLKRE